MTETIIVTWNRNDVRGIAKDRLSGHITNDDANRVLDYVQDNYDASIGINWDAIESAIDELIYNQEITLISLMPQTANNSRESWFLNHSSKLPIFGLDTKTMKLVERYKEDGNLGVLVALPKTEGYTEIILSTSPVLISIESHRLRNRKLNIEQIINLVLPEFDEGVVPTVSELQELLEEGVAQLEDCPEAMVSF